MRTPLPGAAQRKLIVLAAPSNGNLLGDGRAIQFGDPTRQELRPNPGGQPQLVPGDGRGGGIEKEGSLFAGRRRNGDRVRSQASFGGEGGHHLKAAGRHGHADHALFCRHHGVVTDGARVARVVHGHRADSHFLGLLDGESHCNGAYHDPQRPVGVHSRRCRGLSNYLPVGPGFETALVVRLDVVSEHVGDAVGLHPPQVGRNQDIGALGRVLRRHAHLLEDGGDRLP